MKRQKFDIKSMQVGEKRTFQLQEGKKLKNLQISLLCCAKAVNVEGFKVKTEATQDLTGVTVERIA